MSDNDSFNQGLWGTGPNGNTNWNDYQQGKSIRDWNERMHAEQNKPMAASTWGADATQSYGYSQPMPTYAGPSGAGYVSGSRGKPGILAALLLTPVFVMVFPLWAALYPLSAIATILTAAMSGNTLRGLAPGIPADRAQLAAVGLAVVVLVACARIEQLLGGVRLYRYLRYTMRLVTFGILVIWTLLPGPGLSAWSTSPHLVSGLLREPGSLGVIAAVAVGLHWLTLRSSLRGIWHGFLRTLRLRSAAE